MTFRGSGSTRIQPLPHSPIRPPLRHSGPHFVIPAPTSSFPRRRESRRGGDGKCSAEARPPLGRGWAWQNSPCKSAAQGRNSGFTFLGVPAQTGMSDRYENDLTWPRACPHATAPVVGFPVPSIRHSGPHFVIPALTSSFRRRPESKGAGTGNAAQELVPRSRRSGNQS